ncbi:ester cyclase [Nonomuraea sp. NPDC000554]|uniref:ester cyclase n=1 Tax=Nonomuraea sp. NPDC000554 TaxID=3154259 RepID=UPI0033222B0A
MNLTFGYTVLYVADVERTLAFYIEAFGLQQRFCHPGGQYAELHTGTTVLAFAEHGFAVSSAALPTGVSATRPDAPPPGLNLTLLTDDVPSALTRAVRAGAEKVTDVVVKPWGQTVALVRDLDGVLVELATPTGRDQATNTPQARHLIDRYFQAWNTGDLDILDDVIAADYVNHNAGMPDVPPGPDGLRPIISGMRAGFPDLHYEIEHLVTDGDVVAVRTTVTGTHTGPLFGQPPTGRAFRVTQMQFERIRGGRIVEHWRLTDDTTMTQQLQPPADPE